jgi:hypothetical protein
MGKLDVKAVKNVQNVQIGCVMKVIKPFPLGHGKDLTVGNFYSSFNSSINIYLTFWGKVKNYANVPMGSFSWFFFFILPSDVSLN